MPSFKVGARGEGAVSALLSIVQERKAERKDREKALRDFNLELVKLGVKQALEDRSVEPEYDASGYFTGRFKKATMASTAFDPSTLRIGEKVELGAGDRVTKRTFQIPPFTTQAQYLEDLSPTPAAPVAPVAPSVPSLTSRIGNFMQSGGPQDFARAFSAATIGRRPQLGLPGMGAFPVQRPRPAAVSPRPTLPRSSVAPPPQADATQLLSDVTAALQAGFTAEEISEQLRDLGLDDATIAQLLQSAGA